MNGLPLRDFASQEKLATDWSTMREAWLTDERFRAVEVMVAPDAAAMIATRV